MTDGGVGSGALLGVWSEAPNAIEKGRGQIASPLEPAVGAFELRESFEWCSRAPGPNISTPIRVLEPATATDTHALLRSPLTVKLPRALFFGMISDARSLIGADTSQRQR